VNMQDKDGDTPLHFAVGGKIPSDIVSTCMKTDCADCVRVFVGPANHQSMYMCIEEW
jgi:hypothetical protein